MNIPNDTMTVQVCHVDYARLDADARAAHGHPMRPDTLGIAEAVEVVSAFVLECARTRPRTVIADHHDRVIASSDLDGPAATVGALRWCSVDHGPHHPLLVLVKPSIRERLRGRRTLRLYWPANMI